ncbi:MAG: helicase-related protein [Bacillota bacterium]|nr:helicase-related protein [Bacillota bacterium]
MKPPKMLDNKRNGKVSDELRENLRKGSKLSVITAYFTIYAFNDLKKELSKIDKMRFIFTEPTFVKKDRELIREYYIAKNEKNISGNEFEIKLRNELKQSHIARECAEWLKEKVEIKSLKQPNHAQPRLIYIENPDDNISINGTVDFTSDGLGITNSNRIDSNMCIYGKDFTLHFLKMFDELWDDETAVEDVKQKVLDQMQILYKENTPEFIYFVTLYNIFSQYLDELTEERIVRSGTGFKDSMIWNKLYRFQKDGVMGAIDKIEKYNGCIIADSVGLGKTFTALAVIKYYESRNDRVLVLVPKKLRENWTIYTRNDKLNIFEKDRFRYDVLNHTDLTRYTGKSGDINLETINWQNYDLVVIDESHNFRNNQAAKNRVTRYQRLMNDIIKSGVKTKVLMLSATPVNNRMNDIKNQISFITEGNDKAFADLGLNSIEQVLRKSQAVFNKWSKFPDEERSTDSFVEMMDIDYFKLLDTVTIARSRKHIEKYYNMEEIGKFPTRRKPQNIYADIDLQKEFPPLEKVNKSIKNLQMAVYSPLAYILPEHRGKYSKKYDMSVASGQSVFRQTDRENQLVNLMRVNLLKRMESSIHSFALTVSKILQQVDNALEKINEKQFDYDPNIDISEIDFENENQYDDLMFGNKVKVMLQDMDLIKWEQELRADKERLERLLLEAKKVSPVRDAKLELLKAMIQEKIKHPINGDNKKLLIFTAFSDTANYLYDNLADWMKAEYKLHMAMVTGSDVNRTTLKSLKRKDLNSILTSFSPRSKERNKIYPEMTEEIDVLIGTDCISEGQNLQDCDFVINYDIHWNPVRIIQRFGRIDRIGSVNDEVQLVNFWPNMELDEYIHLENRVKGRMVVLDISATGEENVIEYNETKEMNDLEYRKKQLVKLKDKVMDLEDISGGISITDLTFNDFKIDLMEYMKNSREELEQTPNGMYAITRPDETLRDVIKPGVIFTLKQIKGYEQTKELNSLFPYFMVYIADDREVRYSYLHVKKQLDFYKKLCSGSNVIADDLVKAFNMETNDGRNMKQYSDLLEAAIENIMGKKEELGVASLFSKGGTTLQKSLFSGIEEFEMVSFLIVKS